MLLLISGVYIFGVLIFFFFNDFMRFFNMVLCFIFSLILVFFFNVLIRIVRVVLVVSILDI